MKPIKWLFHKTPEVGAKTQVMLATDPELEQPFNSGKYFVDCKEKEPSDKAKDEELADWLWNESLRLTGLKATY